MCLLRSCNSSQANTSVTRVNGCARCHFGLRFGAERSRGGDIADIKVGNNAEHALLFFGLDLIFRRLFLWDYNLHIGHVGGNG